MPWEATAPKGEEHTPYRWELYNINADYSEADNLAAQYPQKLKSLQKAFEKAAVKYQVEPINDEFLPRFNSALRPSQLQGRNEFVYYPSNQRIAAAAFPALTRNWQAVANIRIDAGDSGGPIIANGSKFCGWSLYLSHGTPMVTYRATDEAADWIVLKGEKSLSPGSHRVTVGVSSPNAQGVSDLTLDVDGKIVATHRLNRLVHAQLASYVGRAPIAPLIEDDQVPSRFSGGRIDSVAITLLPKAR
jgi:arylsulfatase